MRNSSRNTLHFYRSSGFKEQRQISRVHMAEAFKLKHIKVFNLISIKNVIMMKVMTMIMKNYPQYKYCIQPTLFLQLDILKFPFWVFSVAV